VRLEARPQQQPTRSWRRQRPRPESEPQRSLIEESLARHRAEREALPPVREEARRELAAVEEVLASRERTAAAAARIVPPPYLVAELGPRPGDRTEARAWDRGAGVIETYRRESGVSDPASAFAPEPDGGAAKARRRNAVGRTERVQRQLREVAVSREVRERSAEHRSHGLEL